MIRRDHAPGAGAPAIVRRLEGSAVYLTFDDGPDPHWTPRVLELLACQQAGASFFVVGQLATRFGALLRQAHAAGHAIGSHGWSHRHPWRLGRAEAEREVREGADAIAQAIGACPHWFRPPHGRITPALEQAARQQGHRIALWSLSGIDWGPFGESGRIARRLAAVRRGDIVLLHDGPWLQNRPAATLAALPASIARMRRDRHALLPLPDATLAA